MLKSTCLFVFTSIVYFNLCAQNDVINYSGWVNNSLTELQYDKNGNVNYRQHLKWDKQYEVWKKESLKSQAFDEENISIEFTKARFDESKNMYVQTGHSTTETLDTSYLNNEKILYTCLLYTSPSPRD